MAVVEPRPFRIRSLGLSIYLPTLLLAIGQGAVIPFIPLLAKDLGASNASASFVVGLTGIGMMLFDIPAGVLMSVLGERAALMVGTAILVLVSLGAAFSNNQAELAILAILLGFAWSIWQLARLAYVSEVAPLELRGRALSLIGGTNRIGNFLGPFLGGILSSRAGFAATFYLQGALAVAAGLIMFVLIDGNAGRVSTPGTRAHRRLLAVASEHRHTFATAGFVTICLSLLRSARQAVIPLWGSSIGLSAAAVGVVYGASNGIDMLLFYPAGSVMDRFGRKYVAIPSLLTLALGLALIPLARTVPSFALVAMLTGFGNGLGAGVVMTLGADFSPAVGRAEFLSVWRLVSDVGQSGGPLALAGLTGAASLGFAALATSGVGVLGALVMWRFVSEPLKRRDLASGEPGVRAVAEPRSPGPGRA